MQNKPSHRPNWISITKFVLPGTNCHQNHGSLICFFFYQKIWDLRPSNLRLHGSWWQKSCANVQKVSLHLSKMQQPQPSSVWKCPHFPKDFSFWNVPLAWQLESCWWFSQLANKQEMLEKEYKEETTEKGNPQFRTAFFGVTNLHWCIKVPKERDEQKLGMVYGSLLGKHGTFNIIAMFSSSFRPVQFRPWTTSRENGRIFHLPAYLISLAKNMT